MIIYVINELDNKFKFIFNTQNGNTHKGIHNLCVIG